MTAAENQIWVKFRFLHKVTMFANGNRGHVNFEYGGVLVSFPRDEFKLPPENLLIKPKEVIRETGLVLKVNTGFWQQGLIELTFDSEEDANVVELELKKLLPAG